MSCTVTIDLFKCLKKSTGTLVDSPTWRVGESFFHYEYVREFEAKIGTYAEPIYAKTPENPPHCHVLLSNAWEV